MLKDFVSKVFYLNLDFRTDKREQTERFLNILGLNNFERFDTIKTKVGYHGQLFSQVAILERAMKEKLDYVMICDDNLTISEEKLDKFLKDVELFFKHVRDWDVLMLGGEIKEKPKSMNDYCIKSNAVQDYPAYIIRGHYLKTYLNCLKSRQEVLKKKPYALKQHVNAPDTCVRRLQQRNNWYMIYPNCLTQRSYSE